MNQQVENKAIQIDTLLNQLHTVAEQQREILFGTVQSDITTTQGHILMLLNQKGPQTNKELAEALQVSRAAITKAMKGLQTSECNCVIPVLDAKDARLIRFTVNHQGAIFAKLHGEQHAATLAVYEKIMQEFSSSEQQVIGRFITALDECLQEE
ncbi:MarR family transcriptional regulator [Weissella coleopterorum]|uniref:MarR family transcriptional regulator n=1 Tax=Weissella coleopterorum TaxID=2714949 RepID=A0A6G8AYK9_9LACO|nr:MarR family transcriptional regulator [Weissella coleopterorum]QIL50049.1 MarR family transcriptional regulator [Weissella coleopterorum]